MGINNGLFQTGNIECETPDDFYAELNRHFGSFDLDPCATKYNAKCPKFFTKEDNGLKHRWFGKVFMNPPYGRQIGNWIKKAYEESQKGATVVCLLPARTDTIWFHEYCSKGDIRFIKGRLKFNGQNSAPFPSMIVIFRPPLRSKK